jgi:hypothetical protein
MSSILNTSNNISPRKNNIYIPIPSLIHKSKKCPIRKSVGLITPKDPDNYPLFLFSENTNENENIYNNENDNDNDNNARISHEDTIKIKIVKNHRNITWSKNPFLIVQNQCNENQNPNISNAPRFDATQEFIKIINQDSLESLVPCKPMLNSTASKSYMVEYSKTKKFQEDIKNFPSEEYFDISNNMNMKNNKNSTPSTNSHTGVIEEEEDSFSEIQDLLKYQEEHLPVPIEEKNNENFKILTMKKMKRKSMPPNKSVRKFAEDREPEYEKESRIQNSFCQLLKRKVVHSTRRIYSSHFILGKGKNKVNFMIFRDKDIGVYEYWQAHIHESHNDEDVETDEEQKNLAKCYTFGEIKELFMFIKNRNFEDTFTNLNRYSKYMKKGEYEKIKKEIFDLKNKIKL